MFVTLTEHEKDLPPFGLHTGIHFFDSTNLLQLHLYLLSYFLSQLFHYCAHDNFPHFHLCNVILILILTLFLAFMFILIPLLINTDRRTWPATSVRTSVPTPMHILMGRTRRSEVGGHGHSLARGQHFTR
jgi:hypothetical protein